MAGGVRAQILTPEPPANGGQAAEQKTISASGVSVVKQLPTSLRVTVPLSGKGRTPEEAVANLKVRRESAAAQVLALKADKKDVTFGDPSISNAQTDRQRQVEQLIAQRRSQGQKVPKGLLTQDVYLVDCSMTVEWPFASKTAEEFLLESHNLVQKIKKAELIGKSDTEKLTPEEEEVADEIANAAESEDGNESQSTTVQIFYVARVPEKDREKAFADAFVKAKKNGEDLAKAAGVELGPVVAIAGIETGNQNTETETYASTPWANGLHRVSPPSPDAAEQQSNESVGADPDSMKFTYSLNVIFKMGK
jgi:uncharacterized protein YggE